MELDNWFNPELVTHETIDDLSIHFKFRSRTTGVEEWVCIFCGRINETRMRPQSWTLRCAGDLCRRSLGFGRIAYLLSPGPRISPPDIIIPDQLQESFPMGDLARWTSGQPIHRVGMIQFA